VNHAGFPQESPACVLPQFVTRATVPFAQGFKGREGVMRGVAVALPLSIVGLLILNSVAWAGGDSDRPGEMCGRDERGHSGFNGPPGPRWDRRGRDRGDWGEKFARDKGDGDRIEREKIRREVEEEANAIIEEGMRKADAKMQEAIALKRNTEALQAYLSEETAKAKKVQEDAAQHQHDADEKARQADEAKKAADAAKKASDDQVTLLKADRERQETRLMELLAHDPCGAQTTQGGTAGGAGTH
jgi:hypothetical protein